MTVFRFDDVEVDALAFQARKAGTPVPLEPKALEVLLFLVRSDGRLVTKSALLEAVWPGTFVTESALTRLVAQLRKALGDDAHEARYIETVPTRGYRFVGRLNGAPSGDAPPSSTKDSAPPREPAAWARPRGRSLAIGTGLVTVAIAVVLLASSRRTPAPAAAPLGTTSGRMLVSSTTGFNAYPAFSPDGSSLAFASDRTGALEIWIRSLVPGARELQVTSDGHNNVQPAWSPDGRLLAYTSLSQGGVWVVPALGGVPRQVTTFGSKPSWSPDGSSLAFLSNEIVQIEVAGSSTSRIWLVSAAGGTPRPLTERWDPPGGHRSVSFAPDGRRMAFMAGGQVWLLDLRDGTRRKVDLLSSGPGFGLAGIAGAGEVQWSSDGRSLVGLGKHEQEVVLWRHELQAARSKVSSPFLVTEPNQRLGHLALAPDGRRIAFTLVNTHADLLTLPFGRDGAVAGDPRPLFPALASRKAMPLFSLDGGRVSFQVWRPGEGGVIYTAGSEGTPAQAGTVSSHSAASFDPLGRLVLVTSDGTDRRRLVEIDPTSGRERTLRELPPAAWLRLSPDGKEVAFMCGGEPVFAVCVAGALGGEPQPLLAPKDGAGWPAWSPDGRQLAVELFDGEDTYVAVVPRTGSGSPRRVTSEPGQSWPHSWTPDGQSVVFAGQRRGIWNVYAVDLSSGRERRLTRYDRATVNVRYPAWSPRNDQVVFEYGETTGNVWIAPLP